MTTTTNGYLVVIDLTKLGRHFSQADFFTWTAGDVETWLAERGFEHDDDGWICWEEQLGLLEASECRVVRRL